jgi:hypothetical protein
MFVFTGEQVIVLMRLGPTQFLIEMAHYYLYGWNGNSRKPFADINIIVS